MEYHHRPYNILIADDQQLIIAGLTGILNGQEQIGTIQSAKNGQEAIAKLMNSNIDCVLMDINMPLMNGFEATKIIKKQLQNVKVVMISVSSDPAEILALLDVGADGFVVKDISKSNLLDAIDKVMRNERYVSRELDSLLCNYSSVLNDCRSDKPNLTAREATILAYLAEGADKRQIAEKLFLNQDTVDAHFKNMMAKLSLKKMSLLKEYATRQSIRE